MEINGIPLRCPHCRGGLNRPAEEEIVCLSCGRKFPVTLGIPDLRIFPDPYIGFEDERAKVKKLAAQFDTFDFEGFVDFYYRMTDVVPPQHAALYKRGLLTGVARARAALQAWETEAKLPRAEALLEIGCGTAPLLVAAEHYPRRIGVDIALRWLVVGKKRLQQAGMDVPLVAACAEALPFADGSFDRVAAESAVEHLSDQRQALGEAHRVLRPGGAIFLSTPNKFSLGPDPQTGVWCGSFLPKSWTDKIVLKQGGIPPKRKLLTASGLKRLLRGAGFENPRVWLPGIPEEQRAQFSAAMRAAIGAYDVARRIPVSRELLHWVGPLFLAAARKK